MSEQLCRVNCLRLLHQVSSVFSSIIKQLASIVQHKNAFKTC